VFCDTQLLTTGTALTLEPCSSVASGSVCWSDSGPSNPDDAYPSRIAVIWSAYPFDRVDFPGTRGFSFSNSTHATAVVGHGSGIAILVTDRSGSGTTVAARLSSFCDALIPVGLVGSRVIAVTADGPRCECAFTSATGCQMEGMRIRNVNGTDFVVPMVHGTKDPPAVILPSIVESTGVWVNNTAGFHTVCGSLTNNGTDLFNRSAFTLISHLQCFPLNHDEELAAVGALAEVALTTAPLQYVGYYNLNGQNAVPRFGLGNYLFANITSALDAGSVTVTRGSSVRGPKPLFPGSAPLGLVSFDLSTDIAAGVITPTSNITFFENAFFAVLETTVGGTRPYLWVGSWDDQFETEIILLDVSNPTRPVRLPNNFEDFGDMTSPRFLVQGNQHYAAAIVSTPPDTAVLFASSGALRVWNVTDPQNVVQTAEFPMNFRASFVTALCGNVVFAQDENNQESTGNMTYAVITNGAITSTGKFQVADFDPQRGIYALSCDDKYLYIAIGQNGVSAYNYSTLPPTFVGRVEVLSPSLKTSALDGANYLYDVVGGGGSGVHYANVHVWNSAGTALQLVQVLPFFFNVTGAPAPTTLSTVSTVSSTVTTLSTVATSSTTSTITTSSAQATTSSTTDASTTGTASPVLTLLVSSLTVAVMFSI